MATKKPQKIKWKEGDVFEVPLRDGWRGYGQVIGNLQACVFFDRFTPEEQEPLSASVIADSPIAWRIQAALSAVLASGGWRILGNAPFSAEAAAPLFFWRRFPGRDDVLRKTDLRESWLVPSAECL